MSVASTYAEYYGGTVSNVPSSGARSGEIALDLFIGDDYLSSNGRALSWTVAVPSATTIGGSSCTLRFVRASGSCTEFEIEFDGTITAADTGYATLTFSMTDTETATIPAGEYFWFVEWVGDAGEVITKVYNRQLVRWRDRVA